MDGYRNPAFLRAFLIAVFRSLLVLCDDLVPLLEMILTVYFLAPFVGSSSAMYVRVRWRVGVLIFDGGRDMRGTLALLEGS